MNPTLAPESIHAVIVGIEQFDVGWNLAGPASDAVRFAEWVWKKKVPTKNIHLFLSPLPKNQTKIEKQCQEIALEYFPAIRANIRKMVVEQLPELTGSLLFLYWSGHGIVVDGLQRRLFYADASKQDPKNFMVDQALEKFRSMDLSHFSHQIAFIDACASTFEALPQDEIPIQGKLNPQSRQFVLFSAGLGKTAINRETKNTTEFGQCLLKALERKKTESLPPTWEKLEKYFTEIGNDIDEHFQILEKQGAPNQSPVQFRWLGWGGNERVRGLELGQAKVKKHERWLRWLSVYPLPPITTINPYQELHLTKGEVGSQYDFDNKDALPPYVTR
ncbi:MAG: caspase family protein, partial [Nitrospirales bacterium]